VSAPSRGSTRGGAPTALMPARRQSYSLLPV